MHVSLTAAQWFYFHIGNSLGTAVVSWNEGNVTVS